MQILGGSIRETRLGATGKSPIYHFLHIEEQILGLILSFFQVVRENTGHNFYLYKVSQMIPSNF